MSAELLARRRIYALPVKVFLSWSKDLSHDVALYFASWLPGVIQECSSPFISSDIDKGEPWFETITGNLGSTDLGLVFITAENQDAVWLNFEAGAMLNKFGKSGVCPILVGVKKGDYHGPLKNLQLTELTDEGDVKQLLGTINKKCANPLDQPILDKMLGVFWSDLQTNIAKLIQDHAEANTGHTTSAKRDLGDKVDELLSLMRGIAAKESITDEKIAATNTRISEVMSVLGVHDLPPNKKYVARSAVRSIDGTWEHVNPRNGKAESARQERLSRFSETQGSLDVILPDHEQGEIVDVRGSGADTELVVSAKDTGQIYNLRLNDVTVIPF